MIMRLIDADEAIINFGFEWDDISPTREEFVAFLKKQPIIDAVEVVRCKDCTKFKQTGKYYNGTPYGYCYHLYYEPGSSPNELDGDDYCSYGKRSKEND